MVNPEKGWIATANNVQSSTHATVNVAQNELTTGRAYRIQRYMEKLVADKSGEIVYSDMQTMLNDVTDEFCLEKLPNMLKVVPEAEAQFGGWDCVMDKESSLPVLWHIWEIVFTENFGKDQLFKPFRGRGAQDFQSMFWSEVAQGTWHIDEVCGQNSCVELARASYETALRKLNEFDRPIYGTVNN